MKYIKSIFLLILTLTACQSKLSKTSLAPDTKEQGFKPSPNWNGSMQNLKKSLVILEPYLFDKKKFNDPKNKKFLSKEIHNLAEESKNVKHNPTILSKDPTARFVAANFSDELGRADENFSTDWTEFARTQLVTVTSYCIECHTRLKEGPEFNYQNSSESYIKNLPIKDQIELMIAFRQFEPAFQLVLKTLKEISPTSKIQSDEDQVARLGLLIAVQLNQNKAKAQQLISTIANNSNLPFYLKQNNNLWKESLSSWDPNKNLVTLPEIRKLIKNRKSEIDDMRAINSLLKVLIDDLNPDELGEALLLTGESYEALNKVSLMSLHETYYESCVRRVPKTKWGKACFDKLNESIAFGYTGSAGTHIPLEIQKRLQDLKKAAE